LGGILQDTGIDEVNEKKYTEAFTKAGYELTNAAGYTQIALKEFNNDTATFIENYEMLSKVIENLENAYTKQELDNSDFY
jgi:hypothetical protein